MTIAAVAIEGIAVAAVVRAETDAMILPVVITARIEGPAAIAVTGRFVGARTVTAAITVEIAPRPTLQPEPRIATEG